MERKPINLTPSDLRELNEPNEPEPQPESEPAEPVSEPEPIDEDTVEIEDTESGRIFELTEAGQQTRINQILESQEMARQAINLSKSDAEIFQCVSMYVSQFINIARTHGYEGYLHHAPMGQIQFDRDVVPSINSTHRKRDPRPANPEEFPIQITGAADFVRMQSNLVEYSVSRGELSSGREEHSIAVIPPKSVCQDAFDTAEALQNELGLEVSPGQMDSHGDAL